MRFLLTRFSPWLVGVAALLASQWTWTHPTDYPWVLGSVLAAYVAASVILGWKKLGPKDLAAKMLMPGFAFASLVLASLMAERVEERILLTILMTVVPLYSLELLHLLAHQPSRYPVNGLSRLNLALVPLSAYCIAVGLVGMQIFIRWPDWATVLCFTALGAAVARITEHPTVGRAASIRWIIFGAVLGLHVGFLAVVLPVGLEVTGSLAALAFAWPLRARRYSYEPKPPRRLAYIESAGATFFFIAILLVSRWA
ncbi:hypothetical protein IT087_02220 [Candidatus Uhrbacteria bacterium]|nr:hypothetical protein [Candidatus Uhrbacteria bacterium]